MAEFAEEPKRSRRALLAGALGGLGAWTAAVVAGRSTARASDGDPMIVGDEHTSSTPTALVSDSADPVLRATSTAAGMGFTGQSSTGTGVFGSSDTGFAFRGSGRVRFDRVSGLARIPGGRSSVVVAPGVPVTDRSIVLLSLTGQRYTGTVWSITDPDTDTFSIHCSSFHRRVLHVAWLLLN